MGDASEVAQGVLDQAGAAASELDYTQVLEEVREMLAVLVGIEFVAAAVLAVFVGVVLAWMFTRGFYR